MQRTIVLCRQALEITITIAISIVIKAFLEADYTIGIIVKDGYIVHMCSMNARLFRD